jgi:hypothetical protein
MELPRNESKAHDACLDDHEAPELRVTLLRLLSGLDVASLVFATTTVPSVVLAGALALGGLAIAGITTDEIETDHVVVRRRRRVEGSRTGDSRLSAAAETLTGAAAAGRWQRRPAAVLPGDTKGALPHVEHRNDTRTSNSRPRRR